MKKDFDGNAYSQAYTIIKYLIEVGNVVVPEELIDTIEKKKNQDYKFDINDIECIRNTTRYRKDFNDLLCRMYFKQ